MNIDGFNVSKKELKKFKQKIFESEEKAAIDFGFSALPHTFCDFRERGAIIKRIRIKVFDDTSNKTSNIDAYTYGKVFTGGHSNVIFGVVFGYLASYFHFKRVSVIHTHPFCTGHRAEIYSVGDKLVSKLLGVKYMYLAAPTGNLFRYDGNKSKNIKNSDLVLEPIYSKLPKVQNKFDCRNNKLPLKAKKDRR